MFDDMRIFTEQALKEFAERNPSSKTALQLWCKVVKKSKWQSLSDIKATFNSVDYIGNQRFVFNIKGNEYRLVAVIKFSIGFIYVLESKSSTSAVKIFFPSSG